MPEGTISPYLCSSEEQFATYSLSKLSYLVGHGTWPVENVQNLQIYHLNFYPTGVVPLGNLSTPDGVESECIFPLRAAVFPGNCHICTWDLAIGKSPEAVHIPSL